MKLLKFLTKSIFVSLIVLGSTSFVFAETAPAKSNTIVLAKINAQNGKVVSQEGDKLNLSFSISNREGAQSGVRYGIPCRTRRPTARIAVGRYAHRAAPRRFRIRPKE